MERISNNPESTRRPARTRRQGGCVRSERRRGEPVEGRSPAPGDSDRRKQRIERLIDRKVAEKLRARRRTRHDHLDIGRLQRQVERRGGTMRIVIEFPGRPDRPQRRPSHPRRPKFV